MDWEVKKYGKTVVKGYCADVRESLESMIENEIGLFLSLQEDEEEGFIYLHSEYSEELTEAEIDKVIELGFNEHYDDSTIKAMEKLLDVQIVTNREVVEYKYS